MPRRQWSPENSPLAELVIGSFATTPGLLGPNFDQDILEACDAAYERDDGSHPLEDENGLMPYMRGYREPGDPAAAADVVDLVKRRRRATAPATTRPRRKAA